MNSQASREFIKHLGQKHNLSTTVVTDIIKSQFRFVALEMSKGDYDKQNFKNVLLRGFGRFVVSPLTHVKISGKQVRKGQRVIKVDNDVEFINDIDESVK